MEQDEEAGRRIGLSQPATSQALARLRELLGDPLLVRDGRAMRPTPLAERMAPRVRQLIGEMGRYAGLSLALRGNMARSIEEHQRILEAARAGDTQRVVELVGEHIRIPQREAIDLNDAAVIALALGHARG